MRPVGEGLPHDGVGQVDEPLPRQLAELLLVWQVLGAGLVARRLLQDLLDAEALVLGQGQVPDAVGVHELLGALNEGTQVVDGVVLVGGQVCVALDGQEGIATENVSQLVGTYTSRLERYLAANMVAVTYYRALASRISTIVLSSLLITHVPINLRFSRHSWIDDGEQRNYVSL